MSTWKCLPITLKSNWSKFFPQWKNSFGWKYQIRSNWHFKLFETLPIFLKLYLNSSKFNFWKIQIPMSIFFNDKMDVVPGYLMNPNRRMLNLKINSIIFFLNFHISKYFGAQIRGWHGSWNIPGLAQSITTSRIVLALPSIKKIVMGQTIRCLVFVSMSSVVCLYKLLDRFVIF